VYLESLKRNQAHWLTQLETLNPQRTLDRGYAVILDQNRKAARQASDIREDEYYIVQLADGQIQAQFKKKRTIDNY
jgi:exodeoxyribonuclease VII large subunit